MDPVDFHRVAPIVSKKWRQFIRDRPRPVLLNLRLLVESESNNVAQSVGVKVTRPAPLPGFNAVKSGESGEGTIVTCSFYDVPDTLEGIKEFMDRVTGVLRSWMPDKSFGGVDGLKEKVVVVPWEVQLSGPQLKSPKDLDRLSKILAFLDPRVVKISRPPTIIFHLLPANVNILHLMCNPRDDAVDFSALDALDVEKKSASPPIRFGKKLHRIVLDGPVVTDESPSAPVDGEFEDEGDEVEDISGMYDPDDLAPIANLKSLKDLRIGTFFPLADYTDLIPTIIQLKALKTISIRGLYYGDQPGELLANLFISLPNLTTFSNIGDPVESMWPFFAQAGTAKSVTKLKTLSLSFEDPVLWHVEKCIRGVVETLPSVQTLRLSFGATICPVLNPKGLIDAVKDMQLEQVEGKF
ncbi:hypothetical protein HDU67_004157, partial [Dinochytrium kinnereticum]